MQTPSFYVISHERSGTHLAINTLLKNTVGVDRQADIGEWFGPYDDPKARFAHIDDACRDLATHGTLIKSHCDADLFLARYPRHPVVWVVRDPRDTLVSWFHYLNHPAFYANNAQVERFQSRRFGRFLRRPLTEFLRHGYSLAGDFTNVADRWAAHTRSWTRSGLDLCVVRYEDLLTRFDDTLRRMANFLGLELRPDAAPVALGERSSHLPRKGIIGDWQNEATPADLRWLDEVLRRGGGENFYYRPAAESESIRPGTVAPHRLLLLGPESEGRLVLFEPVLRLLRRSWTQTEIALLVRERHADLAPVLDPEGAVRWLTFPDGLTSPGQPGADPAALTALRNEIQSFAPGTVASARTGATWLEGAVGAWLPGLRQVRLGSEAFEPGTRAAVETLCPVDWSAIFPEKVPVDTEENEWERQLRLAGVLVGEEAPRWWPAAHVAGEGGAHAARILAGADLTPGEFVACAVAKASPESWPAEHWGETLAWLEHERGLRTLLLGHTAERETLEAVQAAARHGGANPALWLAQDSEAPVTAGLLLAARFCFAPAAAGAPHLSAALAKPVVALFGSGEWPGLQPVAHRSLSVVPSSHPGALSLGSVRQALEQFLQDETPGQRVFEAEVTAPDAADPSNAATSNSLAEPEDQADLLHFAREDSAYYRRQLQRVETLLQSSEADRDARGRQVAELTPLLRASEADRDARQAQVAELTSLLHASEADRDARGQQVDELTALLHASEADRDARGQQVENLLPLLHASEIDRDARQTQVQEMTALFHASETDRDARQTQIQELTALLKTSETDRDARLAQIEELTALLQTSETDRDARQIQVQEFTALFRTSETDRNARQKQITELTALLKTSETDRDARLAQIEELTALLKTSETDRDARLAQIEELTALLKTSETDRATRGQHVVELTALLQTSEADRAARLRSIEELTAWQLASERGHALALAPPEEPAGPFENIPTVSKMADEQVACQRQD